jgi:F-type H+-transporting ATPase subunit a
VNKRLLVGALLFVLALSVAGLITGAIGAGLVQSPEDKAAGKTAEGPFVNKPAVHLPPQVVAPGGSRDHYTDFLHAEHTKHKYGESKLDDHEKELLDEGPFLGTNFIVTNTLLSCWVASILLVLLFVLGARRASLVPGRLQNFCEIVIEALLRFVEGTVGPGRSRMLFPVIASIFLFVVINAWIGLLPFYPALGFLTDGKVEIHLLRPAGTDINMPLALAIVSFVFVEFLGIKMLGIGYFGKFVRVRSLAAGMSALFQFRLLDAFQGLLDFFFVGPLEAFSEFVRLISFTFRLFGNMTAGEILVLMSAFLVPFVATVGVYGLELLVGLIQGLIFAGLTLVFAAIAMTAHEHEGHEEHH